MHFAANSEVVVLGAGGWGVWHDFLYIDKTSVVYGGDSLVVAVLNCGRFCLQLKGSNL